MDKVWEILSLNDDDSVLKNKYSTLENSLIRNQGFNIISNDGEIKFTLDKYEEKFIKRKLSQKLQGIYITNKKSSDNITEVIIIVVCSFFLKRYSHLKNFHHYLMILML